MDTAVLAESNFLVPNATFIAELAAFAIVLAVLWRYIVPPIQKAMAQRQELIRSQLEEGREASERLAAAEVKYQAALDEARTEAAKIRDDARAQGQHIIDELKQRAQEEADRVTERGREQLAAERETLVRELRADIGQLAVDLASRIVGESLADEARRSGTVDRFLSSMETVDGRLQVVDRDAAAEEAAVATSNGRTSSAARTAGELA